MQRFTDLKVWQKSHALTLEIYRMSVGFPVSERYALSSQIRRAAASVPTNIAEGSKRTGRQEYNRFLNIAEASLAETEYLLILCRDLGYVPAASAKSVLSEVSGLARMLHALRLRVETGLDR
jgi:four helix bundle protein